MAQLTYISSAPALKHEACSQDTWKAMGLARGVTAILIGSYRGSPPTQLIAKIRFSVLRRFLLRRQIQRDGVTIYRSRAWLRETDSGRWTLTYEPRTPNGFYWEEIQEFTDLTRLGPGVACCLDINTVELCLVPAPRNSTLHEALKSVEGWCPNVRPIR